MFYDNIELADIVEIGGRLVAGVRCMLKVNAKLWWFT